MIKFYKIFGKSPKLIQKVAEVGIATGCFQNQAGIGLWTDYIGISFTNAWCCFDNFILNIVCLSMHGCIPRVSMLIQRERQRERERERERQNGRQSETEQHTIYLS